MTRSLRFKLLTLVILSFGVTESVTAAITSTAKSFAVFTTSYNTGNDLVRGGVNGTVFFISPTRAITANHVANQKSFKPLPGFERVRVYLVHEGYPPIEIKAANVRSDANRDVTVIDLPKAKRVPKQYVFPLGQVTVMGENVTSEGFVANTDGPILERKGQDVIVTSVPHLTRLSMQGQLIRQAQVNLKTLDIDLKSSPSVQLSYQPIVGISGGPVMVRGRVIAMNSFADPGTFKQTWALQLRPGIQNLARP